MLSARRKKLPMMIGTFSPIAGSGARILYNAHGRSYGLPFLDPKAKDKHMDKKQQGCLVYVVALFIYLLLGWVVVKAGIQPVAEALGYELPTVATLILVFWVQALAAGNVWQGYGKE